MTNIVNHTNSSPRRFVKTILMVMLLAISMFFIIGMKTPIYAAKLKTISGTEKPSETNILKINKSTLKSITWNSELTEGKDYKNGTYNDQGEKPLPALKINNTSKAQTYENPFSMKFENVGTIGGKSIDCEIKITKVEISKKKGNSPALRRDGFMGVLQIKNDCLEFGLTGNSGYGYMATKDISYAVNMTYHGTNTKVDLPFFQAIIDIDAYQKNGYYREGWTAGGGYEYADGYDSDDGIDYCMEPIFYKYPQNVCEFGDHSVWTSKTAGITSGDDSWYKTGVYINTTDGTFDGTFHEGNCGTNLLLYSQYNNSTETLEPPTLSVDKETAKPGDTITYTVSQKIGTFYSTVLKPYDRIVFTDVIPKEVTLEYPYLDAKILDGNGNNITNQGKLTYDDTTRTLKFEMGDNWRNKESNYNGQTLKLVIKTTANRFKGTKITIPNQAKVSLSNTVTNDTNTVETLVKQFETGDPVDKIQLQIRIPKDKTQQTAAHGKPTFIFKVTGKYSGETYYRSVTFGDKEASVGWGFKEDGDWIVAKSNKMEVPKDIYTAEYIPVSRFAITAKASEMVDVDTDESCILFPFEASKDTWQYYSHNNIAINISICKPR